MAQAVTMLATPRATTIIGCPGNAKAVAVVKSGQPALLNVWTQPR